MCETSSVDIKSVIYMRPVKVESTSVTYMKSVKIEITSIIYMKSVKIEITLVQTDVSVFNYFRQI